MDVKLVESWNPFLENFDTEQRDIYYREEYVKLYRTAYDKPVCFVCNQGEDYLLFPYLLRSFRSNGIWYYDFETVYGYGGPIANTNDTEFISKALKSFYHYGQEYNYVAGFVRFHPLLNNTPYFDSIGDVIMDRHTVAMDLQEDIDSVWMKEVHTKNRNTIKKGSRSGLQFIADYQYSYLDDFIRLYNGTMNKLNADSFYYFDDNYYGQLKKNLPESFLGVVKYDDRVVSSAIFFYSKDYGHYHLSGSDKEFLSLCPNNYMLWEAAKELLKHGVKKFHLGGGANSDENNSLLEFKKKFSKSIYSFQIGKIIFNMDVYNKLCADWEESNPDKSIRYKYHLLKYKY